MIRAPSLIHGRALHGSIRSRSRPAREGSARRLDDPRKNCRGRRSKTDWRPYPSATSRQIQISVTNANGRNKMMIRKQVLGAACMVGAIGLFTVSCDKSNSATISKDASVGTGGTGTGGAGTGGSLATGGAGGGGGAGMPGTQSLYLKYGGAPTVTKVVDDAVAGVLADCQLAPYFAVVGTTGHDTPEELKSCLRCS